MQPNVIEHPPQQQQVHSQQPPPVSTPVYANNYQQPGAQRKKPTQAQLNALEAGRKLREMNKRKVDDLMQENIDATKDNGNKLNNLIDYITNMVGSNGEEVEEPIIVQEPPRKRQRIDEQGTRRAEKNNDRSDGGHFGDALGKIGGTILSLVVTAAAGWAWTWIVKRFPSGDVLYGIRSKPTAIPEKQESPKSESPTQEDAKVADSPVGGTDPMPIVFPPARNNHSTVGGFRIVG